MNGTDQLDELLICRLDSGLKTTQPCTVVIFGASGDLTGRKLIPALYHLFVGMQLPDPIRIVGFARREKSTAQWQDELKTALQQHSRTKEVHNGAWSEFAANLHYCAGDYDDPAAYQRLKKLLASFGHEQLQHNLLFYLAIPPSQFSVVAQNLHNEGLLTREESGQYWQRLVVEKPFGHDLESARQLNTELTRFAHERQILRIDHYLGKETIQNILMFRFSNGIFERLWDRQSIDHVQITVTEQMGVGSRGGYYEEAGALRDVVQNHLLQILAMIAMEPPVSLEAESIRDEKVKLLKSIRPIPASQVPSYAVRGQYSAATLNGQSLPAYRQEKNVRPDSNVETFVALRLMLDNWRWSGVPFYLRAGKRMALSASEVRIQFRQPPSVLFAAQCGPQLDANSLTLRLQPNEGISLRFNGKVPGTSMQIRPVRMQFSYDSEFGAYTPEAYERLLLEAMAGDATLFIRRDEVKFSWGIVDPIRKAWSREPLPPDAFYASGSWGPPAADALLAQHDQAWRNPQP
jgi:glucose-6-phosphate 1-dehydrogenase